MSKTKKQAAEIYNMLKLFQKACKKDQDKALKGFKAEAERESICETCGR